MDIPPGSGRLGRLQWTYQELETQASQVAKHLEPGISADSVVAILLPRDQGGLYIAQLAALKAGAAFTCIDSAFPDAQIREILEDAQPVWVVTDEAGAERLEKASLGGGKVCTIQATVLAKAAASTAPTRQFIGPENLAYLIYTSGTTGRPKGVMIEHRAIANLVEANLPAFGLGPGDRVAQGSSPSYDSSLEETWLAWASGATLVVMDDQAVRLGPDLVPWLRSERITVLCPPPTLLRTTGCENPAGALPDLRLLYVGGEALPQDVVDRWATGCRLVNGYGPTECAVTSMRTDIRLGEPITIGYPVPGFSAWVLDEALNEVPRGQRGELCLGGIGLARGYRNRPELTAEKFPTHPALGRIYRTGDLVSLDETGAMHCFGRIDAQVKLRGYRIELEAIEARLSEFPGVREAACTVQGEGPQASLVAFLVPEEPSTPPDPETLKAALKKILPIYMVPNRWSFLTTLPTTVGGKLDRKNLPVLEPAAAMQDGQVTGPRTPIETLVAAAFKDVLPGEAKVSIHQDFFNDLGGDSLLAAMVVSSLREHPETASITVRDVYEARTVEALAQRIHREAPASDQVLVTSRRQEGHPFLATVAQGLWLLLGLWLGALASYGVAFRVLPWVTQAWGWLTCLLLSPLLGFLGIGLYAVLALGLTVAVKWLFIGRYRPLRAHLWGGFHVRHWMVVTTARLVPWAFLEGTEFRILALRALGAQIGKRVHIHRGVNLQLGGWDLLALGDDVSLGQDALVRLVDLEDGQLVVGPVTMGEGSTLEVRAGVDGHSAHGAGATLTALSSLKRGDRIPSGERWSGVPAALAGPTPPAPEAGIIPSLSPWGYTWRLMGAKLLHALLAALPVEGVLLIFALGSGVSTERVLAWLYHPGLEPGVLGVGAILALVTGPLLLMTEALLLRAMGPIKEGVIPRWSASYLRVWLKAGIVLSAGEWLSGTLFWPPWLRLAGMKVGPGCEISTILDVIPELVSIGAETFFADGIYLGGPRVDRGTVTLGRVSLGANTFLGNHVVIPCGHDLPEDVLVGVSTVAEEALIRKGTSWFGLPPFELPRREIVEMDRSLTHEPSPIRYWNRVFWEALRFVIPVLPLLVFAAWYEGLVWAQHQWGELPYLLGAVPLASLCVGAFFALFILGLKWFLLGRVKPGVHPLWSCWCSRWDFLYVVWGVYGRGFLGALEGSLLLSWYLRAMGVGIGKRVALGPGFSHVVDPDMLHFEDGVTVSAMFQAHTFEDRVLKIDHIVIRKEASVGTASVLLYGADIGERTWVAPHSVVMKRERLLADHDYDGCPTRPEPRTHGSASRAFPIPGTTGKL